MIDTNICIYAMKGRVGSVDRHFAIHADALCISVVTLGELNYGASKSNRPDVSRRGLAAFLAGLDVLPLDTLAAEHFGDIKAHLFKAGTPVGPLDMLIGAHARSLGLTLVTNNRREFDRIPGLMVENWV